MLSPTSEGIEVKGGGTTMPEEFYLETGHENDISWESLMEEEYNEQDYDVRYPETYC
jgi:hypothetical protein